ncbi:hypothetical protein D3C86_1901940 [compost metagenome]
MPLKGTWTLSVPAAWLNTSAIRWVVLAIPSEPKFNLPGRAFRVSTNCLKLVMPDFLLVTSTTDVMPITPTGLRSFLGSYGAVTWRFLLMT